MSKVKRIIVFPVVAIASLLAAILLFLLLLIDKLSPSSKIFASFYSAALAKGEEAEHRISEKILINTLVEAVSGVPHLGIVAGDRGVVSSYDGVHYTVEFQKDDGCVFAPMMATELHKVG